MAVESVGWEVGERAENMAKNQKNEAVRARFRTYASTLAAAAAIAISGLGLVHQHNLQHELAKQALVLDRATLGLEEKLRHATRVEATLRSPVKE